MNPFETRRRWMAFALFCALPGWGWATDPSKASTTTLLQFDAVYIPALFLTGNAGKSVDAAAKALAATKRLSEQWPSLKPSMVAAVPERKSWSKALQVVEDCLREADALAANAQWQQAHEALEHVREVLFETRRSLSIDYPLDEFTAYHAVMEKLASVSSVQRPALEVDFAKARAMWRHIESTNFDASTYGLSPARSRQLAQALADESAALSALSQALHAGSDAEVLKATAAIKPPFVRAYVVFGAPL